MASQCMLWVVAPKKRARGTAAFYSAPLPSSWPLFKGPPTTPSSHIFKPSPLWGAHMCVHTREDSGCCGCDNARQQHRLCVSMRGLAALLASRTHTCVRCCACGGGHALSPPSTCVRARSRPQFVIIAMPLCPFCDAVFECIWVRRAVVHSPLKLRRMVGQARGLSRQAMFWRPILTRARVLMCVCATLTCQRWGVCVCVCVRVESLDPFRHRRLLFFSSAG